MSNDRDDRVLERAWSQIKKDGGPEAAAAYYVEAVREDRDDE